MKRLILPFLFLIASFYIAEAYAMPNNPVVILQTNQGDIEIELMADIAPKACENFQKLVEKHFYDGIKFHRVIQNFMIQSGDPTATGIGGESIWRKPFEDECLQEVAFDRPGLLAMANRGPNTNGSQFFITTVETPWLHMKHTIFGKVIKGFDVVKKIEKTPTLPGDKPLEEQKIVKAYIKK